MTLVIKRSALKMWLMAMGGIPFLIISLDVLTNRRITNWLRELIFRPEDTQIYEPRDVIWAWAMLVFSAIVVLWGLKELFAPTRVVEATDDALLLKLSGPFRPATAISWDLLDDVRAVEVSDEGDKIPMLAIRVLATGDLPDDPWGARWLGDRDIALLAQDWSDPPDVVAAKIIDYAVEAVRRQARARTSSVWKGGDD